LEAFLSKLSITYQSFTAILFFYQEIIAMDNHINPEKFKKSSIGTHIASSEVELRVEEKYSWFGWFMITWFGTSQNPFYIGFHCLKTGELFEELTKKKDIQYFMLYRVE
jgi:hypothetical protein